MRGTLEGQSQRGDVMMEAEIGMMYFEDGGKGMKGV